MIVKKLEKYTIETANRIRELLIELSRSGKDKGEIPREWFEDVINSNWHDLLIAKEDGQILGLACLSVTMGPGIRKNAYLEDFVVDSKIRGRGTGSVLWNAMLDWAKEKGCNKLEFTCGNGREAAQAFYKNHGAEIYETNFFRKDV
ncbi:MAG: GNAT family N-acetyltransferase [Candidatus Saccharibacteria bacterium]|nr:GNAT family N-acetyltransferase [Candidatus Saccharibacteria bacterium]